MAKSELHYHGCSKCRRRYNDTCTERPMVTVQGVCMSCRMGRTSTLMTGIEPRDCCRKTVRLANKNDLKTYRLAGPGPWWLCLVCARQFAYDPRITHE